MATHKHVTDEQVTAALQRNGGRVAGAARDLKISRQSLHERLATKPNLRSLSDYNRQRMDLLILAVNAVHAGVEAGEFWSSKFALRTWGHEFGWGYSRPSVLSDTRCEELISYLGGDLKKYRAERSRLEGIRPVAGHQRQSVIQRAAAAALRVKPKDAWVMLRAIDTVAKEGLN
jgi:hypothetical protein